MIRTAGTSDLLVFAGPSLRPKDVESLDRVAINHGCRLIWRPPIRRDDLLVAEREFSGTTRALILDGEFHQRLSVSVSEIRYILNSGSVELHGASSMGALRAVECRTIGMVGHGWVYEQYLSGTTESDGDVALLFDPFDFSPVSVPLINLRWLLRTLHDQGTIASSTAAEAYLSAKSLHYTEREPKELAREWKRTLSAEVVDILLPQLHDTRRDNWDRKRLDAMDAVKRLVAS